MERIENDKFDSGGEYLLSASTHVVHCTYYDFKIIIIFNVKK